MSLSEMAELADCICMPSTAPSDPIIRDHQAETRGYACRSAISLGSWNLELGT